MQNEITPKTGDQIRIKNCVEMTESTPSFIAAYLDSSECELFLDGNKVVAFVPKRQDYRCIIELGTTSYVAAELVARSIGLEPKWN